MPVPDPNFWTQAAAWRNQTLPYTPSGIASLPPKWLPPPYSYEEPGRDPDVSGGYDPDEPPHFGTPKNQMTESMKQEIVDYYAEKVAAQDKLKKFIGISSLSPWQALAGKFFGSDRDKLNEWNLSLLEPNVEYLSDKWKAANPEAFRSGVAYDTTPAEKLLVTAGRKLTGRGSLDPGIVSPPTPSAVTPSAISSLTPDPRVLELIKQMRGDAAKIKRMGTPLADIPEQLWRPRDIDPKTTRFIETGGSDMGTSEEIKGLSGSPITPAEKLQHTTVLGGPTWGQSNPNATEFDYLQRKSELDSGSYELTKEEAFRQLDPEVTDFISKNKGFGNPSIINIPSPPENAMGTAVLPLTQAELALESATAPVNAAGVGAELDAEAARIRAKHGLPPSLHDQVKARVAAGTLTEVPMTPERKAIQQARFDHFNQWGVMPPRNDPPQNGQEPEAPDPFAPGSDSEEYGRYNTGGMVNPRPMMGGIGGRGEVLRRMFRRAI